MTKRRALWRGFLATWLGGITGCSLVVDASDIDAGCTSEQKLCPQVGCVRLDDPAYGCAPDKCAPCLLINAIPVCDGSTCDVAACLFGFDCPTPDEGCAINILTDKNHCGDCINPCDDSQTCRNGLCVPS